ncbi:DnaJ domain-containing protein [Desulfogranum mediterraneum]|uniref:DnaJ domain-containing protein n=1 Tax=Desulfogranum mediterraneum TaxID=160661 RepID=UPI00040B40EE|nr:DnaJ domain-containing protein [Desulfogranum mediterraneum]
MEYRQHNQPGCGGCLLIIGLLLLVTGGAPALLNFLGFLFFSGIFGVLLLVAAFWGFSYYVRQRVSTYEASQTESHNRFVYLLVHILVKIAKDDGHFTRAELNTILNFFQHNLRYNQDQMYWVKQLVKEARDAEYEMEQLLEEFRNTFAYEPRLILLELIYQIIYTKQPPVAAELELARRIAEYLQISSYDQRTCEAKYTYRQRQEATSGAALDERCYAVLGLESGADFAAIKSAYRKLSMQYHPDKVGHLGDEFKGVAEEKMKEINAAYDHLKKKYKVP